MIVPQKQKTKLQELVAARFPPRKRKRESYHTRTGIDFAAVARGSKLPMGRPLPVIRPDVLAATADELMAAGWGETQRWRIPADWRSRRGPARAVVG